MVKAVLAIKIGEAFVAIYTKGIDREEKIISKERWDSGVHHDKITDGLDDTWEAPGSANVWVFDTVSGRFDPGSVNDGDWTGQDGPNITVELPSGRREFLSKSVYTLTNNVNGLTIKPDHPKFTLFKNELTEL